MCNELGKDEYMQNYILEAGGVSLCTVAATNTTPAAEGGGGGDGAAGDQGHSGCNPCEVGYITAWAAKPVEAIRAESVRLSVMGTSRLTADLAEWLRMRKVIMKQLVVQAVQQQQGERQGQEL